MKPILVSIIVPCYNVEDYVAECLDSAINQTYSPIEIIAIDNNSTDRTLSILEDFEKRYPELITVLEEKKQGAPAARNKGLSVAKGEWLQFLDADCILFSDKIKHQIYLIKTRDNNATMVVSASYVKTLSGDMKLVQLWKNEDPFKAVLFYFLGSTYSNLFSKTAVQLVGYWEETLFGAQDPDIIFKILELSGPQRLLYDETVQSVSKQRVSGQITTSNPLRFNTCALEVRLNMCKKIERSIPLYYRKNILFFRDAIFYFIARLAAFDVGSAKQYFDKYIGSDYVPKFRSGIISIQQSYGVQILGFKNYFYFRKFLRRLLKTLFPDYALKSIFENVLDKFVLVYRK
jgi:glycosyltransferase involved in cell wall biosynthesis